MARSDHAQCREQYRGRRIQRPHPLQLLVLDRLAKLIVITPPVLPAGELTTTLPGRISCFGLGAPPPIPTISPNRIDVKLRSMSLATDVADVRTYLPVGRQAMTTL
jgi:hypothetical protein